MGRALFLWGAYLGKGRGAKEPHPPFKKSGPQLCMMGALRLLIIWVFFLIRLFPPLSYECHGQQTAMMDCSCSCACAKNLVNITVTARDGVPRELIN